VQPLPNPGASARVSGSATRWQPRRYRHRIRSLAYVRLDTITGGVLRNLSEDGVELQVVGPLRLGQELALRFELLNPRLRAELCGCVVWTNAHGQAGVEFLDVQPALRRQLKEWIFNQLLATAELAGAESIFIEPETPRKAMELTFSENARSPILLDVGPPGVEPSDTGQSRLGDQRAGGLETHEFSSAHRLATPWWVVDGLILICSVLLFSVIALGMTNTVPAWPIVLVLMLGVGGGFTGLYLFLFQFWLGATPGERLTSIAGEETTSFGADGSEEERHRFR